MGKWIKFNGPWYEDFNAFYPYFEICQYPEHIRKANEKVKQLWKKVEKIYGVPRKFLSTEENKLVDTYNKLDKKTNKLRRDWVDGTPEMKEYKQKLLASVGFCNNGLNKSGTVIETEDGKKYLIGDTNKWGSLGHADSFDDEIKNNTIIKRYKIIKWE